MPFTVDFADGGVEQGEDKLLSVAPKAEDGSALDPPVLTLSVTDPDGDETTYQKGDFTQDGDTFEKYVAFDAPDIWELEVTAEDSAGNTEKASWTQYVDD